MSWYAIFVETGFEEEVCLYIDELKILGIDGIQYNLLVPKRKIYERKQGIRKIVVKNMFPGYILLETDKIYEFYIHVRSIPHIIKFLKSSYYFLEISLKEITQIISMVDNKGLINISQALVINEKVHVTEGPLFGKEGIIKKIDKRKGRAKVEFIINNNSLLIDLGINIIQKQ